jgi:hypothetical protein
MHLDNDLGHLSYSTLVHSGDTWDEMQASLVRYVPEVKAAVSPNAPFGVSLRLSGASAHELAESPSARKELRATLDANDLYLYTVNAFPHGPFKGRRVKELVYEPDWASTERAEYTIAVADVLAEVAPIGVNPSIQSAPLAFRPRVLGQEYLERMTRNVLAVAAHLVELRERTGQTVTLALEPEPYCYLETTTETIDYFRAHLYSDRSVETLSRAARLDPDEAAAALRRHLGIVFDIGHQSVGFERISESLDALTMAEIPILKLQEASALWIPDVDAGVIADLERFAESIYLTQTTERRDESLVRYLNLEDAIAAWRRDPGPREWRVHFHVPVFLDSLGPFRTTRDSIAEALAHHCTRRLSTHLEIETYTWDVLPDHLKTGDIVQYVVRELEWVRDQVTNCAQ